MIVDLNARFSLHSLSMLLLRPCCRRCLQQSSLRCQSSFQCSRYPAGNDKETVTPASQVCIQQ